MADLNDVVSVSVSAATSTPTQEGFGVPLIMNYHTKFAERVRKYTSLAGMITDGFATTDLVYKAAQAIFAQPPSVPYVLIGREEKTSKRNIKLIPVAKDATTYIVYINGTAGSYTSTTATTIATVIDGLKAIIDTLKLNVTVTDNTTDMTIEAKTTAADNFTIYVNDWTLFTTFQDNTTDGGIVDDITAVRLINDDWYGLCLTVESDAIIKAAAAHIEALHTTAPKTFRCSSASADIPASGSSDVASYIKSHSYKRTQIIYDPNAWELYTGGAQTGKMLPYEPGQATDVYKTLTGIVVTQFSPTIQGYIDGKDCACYTTIAGLDCVYQDELTTGMWLDLVTGIDFMTARMKERIFGKLVSNAKIPYTDAGIAVIESEVKAVLSMCTKDPYNICATAPAPWTQVPLAADCSASDKSTRTLNNVRFGAVAQGAIHKVAVSGVVTL